MEQNGAGLFTKSQKSKEKEINKHLFNISRLIADINYFLYFQVYSEVATKSAVRQNTTTLQAKTQKNLKTLNKTIQTVNQLGKSLGIQVKAETMQNKGSANDGKGGKVEYTHKMIYLCVNEKYVLPKQIMGVEQVNYKEKMETWKTPEYVTSGINYYQEPEAATAAGGRRKKYSKNKTRKTHKTRKARKSRKTNRKTNRRR